jgi:hypothetical protein
MHAPSSSDTPPSTRHASPPAPAAARGAPRLPSFRTSAVLAVVMLALGVGVGAAIGPAPASSLAGGSRLPLLLSALGGIAGGGSSPAAAPARAAAAGVGAEGPRRRRRHRRRASSLSASNAAASGAATSSSEAAAGEPQASSRHGSGSGHSTKRALPPVTSVWLIELSGAGFTQALGQRSAAPYIDSQLVPAGELLSGWSAPAGIALAGDVVAASLGSAAGSPPLLQQVIQPPCQEANGSPCTSASAGELAAADQFLGQTLPSIRASAAYREHGLIVVTFAGITSASSAGLPTGAASAALTLASPAGVVLLSPFARAGSRPVLAFDPASPVHDLEGLLQT